MAFIDEIKVFIKAGNGGNGVERWRHEKSKEWSGPSGGNGGKGGDVYILAVSDIGLLFHYKHIKEFKAENGKDGMRDSMHGRNGKDLIIKLPVGSVVINESTGERFSLEKKDQQELILKGGRGGLGNEFFKSSINRSPTETTPGDVGEEADFSIELELFADVGLIGLPNAGKSSLLNALTKAKAKVGNYAFTTLEPNLGDLYGVIIADIPGLIEGASEGKGLGHKFLKHTKRTKLLVHCISAENEDIKGAYKQIRNEIKKFDKELDKKEEVILITKTDTKTPAEIKKIVSSFKTTKKDVLSVSVYDMDALKKLSDYLTQKVK